MNRIRAILEDRLLRLFAPIVSVHYQYDNPFDQQRATTLLLMSFVVGVLSLIGDGTLLLLFPTQISGMVLVAGAALLATYFIVIWLVQRGRLKIASLSFSLVLLLDVLGQFLIFPSADRPAFAIFMVLPIVIAASLLGPIWTILITAGAISGLVFLVYEPGQLQLSAPHIATPLGMIVVAILVNALSRQMAYWARNTQRQTQQLDAAAVISETAATAATLDILLNVVVERIRAAYGFYHAQVFLLDQEKRMARLEASTGKAGEDLLGRGHALAVGSQSVVGRCTYQGEPVVVNDTAGSTVWKPNKLLPDTRAELALPLVIGNEVIGALDVQSTSVNAFLPDDIRSLQIMAGQLATSIEKARLVDELQSRADENQRLFEEAQTNYREIEQLNRRMTREGWVDYLRVRRSQSALGFTLHDSRIRQDTSWTAPMRQAYQNEKSVVIRQDQQAHIAAIPLRVRNEVIGVLEIERGGNQPWTESELQMIETLVERLAMAIENARLYEQATRAAEREHIVNQIAQDVQSAKTIDKVLEAALTELSTVLGASRGIVQISPKIDGNASEQ